MSRALRFSGHPGSSDPGGDKGLVVECGARRRVFRSLLGVTLMASVATVLSIPLDAHAQSRYPSKPIRFVVPFGAGSSPDVIARLLGESISKSIGQPIVVENRSGASTIIGAQHVASSPGDGYTFLYTVNNTTSINPFIYKTLPYKADDFVPVAHVLNVPYVLVTSAQSSYKSLSDLMAGARTSPGALAYASYGIGQGTHVAMARLLNMSGVDMIHVPYKESPLSDLLAGSVVAMFDPATTAIPNIKAGRLRALAVSSAARVDALPGVPAVNEIYKGFVGDSWHGLLAPKGTSQEIVMKMNSEAQKIISSAEFKAKLNDFGLLPVGGGPESFQRFLAEDAKAWSKVVRDNNIRTE